jgi:2,5-diketo-D-gluconate reductase B
MHTVAIQGTAVPALGLGTWQVEGRACEQAVEHALELGYRHIDTARAYGNEAEVGRALARSPLARDEVFLTTKLWRSELAGDRVARAVDGSLRALGTDVVDLLLIHWPVEDVPLGETLEAMLAVRDAGKVRHLGVSNFTTALVREAARHAPLLCNQVEYHPLLGQDALLALADELDLMVTAYSPMAQGEVTREPVLQRIGERHGKSAAQVALRWLVQQPRVAAIPKAASPEHREANLAVFDFALTDEEMKDIAGLARGRRLLDPPFAPAWDD